jgi:SAM-dependent methyltransferase
MADPMLALLKNAYRSIITHDVELTALLKLVDKYGRQDRGKSRILDVGCGYGRNLAALCSTAHDVLGVDIRHEVVAANKRNGLPCLSVEHFKQTSDTYDIVLMSHVIEHFAPLELMEFLDSYLDRLKIGGRLIIATPLMSNYFYDDFDHIKPYQPIGIIAVFGSDCAQVQYASRNKLALRDIWFRKNYFRFRFRRGKYIKSPAARVWQLLEFLSAIVFTLSFHTLGKTDGWIGIFEKTK